MTKNNSSVLDAVAAIAHEAGSAIMAIYSRDFSVELKDDASPLTEADRASHEIIERRLTALTPDCPILSEEADAIAAATRMAWPRYWLVDPLDGTKEFIKRNGEFTVNIALIEQHQPILGVVYAPAIDRIYGGTHGEGAWAGTADRARHRIQVTAHAQSPIRVVGSRSHPSPQLAAYLERIGAHELKSMGSSLKICLVAEGEADVYPRFGPTSEWDTAAAHAVLIGAGGVIIDTYGRPLRYNEKEHVLNPHFLAYGDRSRNWLTEI